MELKIYYLNSPLYGGLFLSSSFSYIYLTTGPFIRVKTDTVPTREISTALSEAGCEWPVNHSPTLSSNPKSL